MGRPSIFSSDYDRRMKRRKVRIAIIASSILLIAVILYTGYRYDIINKLSFNKKNNEVTDKKDNTNKQQNPVKEENPIDKEAPKVEKSYSFTLNNGKEIKLVYDDRDNEKVFKYIAPVDSGVIYSISTNGKNIVVFDSETQAMTNFNIDGNKLDITRNEHVSHTGDIYPKANRLAKDPNYIWHSSPKFIDEVNIAYISQLPWLNREIIKYVWIVNINSKEHRYIGKLSGETLSFGDVSEKGLLVKANEKNFYLKGNGEVTE